MNPFVIMAHIWPYHVVFSKIGLAAFNNQFEVDLIQYSFKTQYFPLVYINVENNCLYC